MRKPLAWLLAGAFALLTPVAASAGPLVSAALTLLLEIGEGLPPVTISGVGATGTSIGSSFATLGAGTAFNASVTTTVPTTAAPPISVLSVKITKNQALGWNNAPASAAFQGVAAIKGLGGLTLLSIPLNLGSPNTFSKSAGGIATTVISGAWTAGATTVTGVGSGTGTPMTAMATGVNNLTAGGAGTLVLVSPVKIMSGGIGHAAAFGVLTLTYVPEPGTLLLLGLGGAGLAARGRRRRA